MNLQNQPMALSEEKDMSETKQYLDTEEIKKGYDVFKI